MKKLKQPNKLSNKKSKPKKEYTQSYLRDKEILDYTKKQLDNVINYIHKFIKFKGDFEDFTMHLIELKSKESPTKI